MNPIKTLSLLILLPFGAFSTWVLWHSGYLGIWQAGFSDPASLQILLDLVIACLLICLWMVRDARQQQRTVWPYLLLTLTAGSIGPLCYLLLTPAATNQASATPSPK